MRPSPTTIFRVWNASRLNSGLLFRCPTWDVNVFNFSTNLKESLVTTEGGATFGFVCSGSVVVRDTLSTAEFTVGRHQYWTTSGPCIISPNSRSSLCHAFIVQKDGFRSLPTMGGPIEKTGRLNYIDGCSDSVLISPPKLGNPCLNLLHFPPNIKQTKHTHPSIRIGAIATGSGFCLLNDGSKPIPLQEGDVFVIPQDLVHSFKTNEVSDMRVIAFHPDSDCGPTDETHPMINKTIISTEQK